MMGICLILQSSCLIPSLSEITDSEISDVHLEEKLGKIQALVPSRGMALVYLVRGKYNFHPLARQTLQLSIF